MFKKPNLKEKSDLEKKIIIDGIVEEDAQYFAKTNFLSSSKVKDVKDCTLAEFKATPALAFGTAAHQAAYLKLQNKPFVVVPKFESENLLNKGREQVVLSRADDRAKFVNCMKSLDMYLEHRKVDTTDLLQEQSFYMGLEAIQKIASKLSLDPYEIALLDIIEKLCTELNLDGIKWKPDAYDRKNGILYDWKTTTKASVAAVKGEMWAWHYFFQAVFYSFGLKLLGHPVNSIRYVFLGKYAASVVTPMEVIITPKEERWKEFLHEYLKTSFALDKIQYSLIDMKNKNTFVSVDPIRDFAKKVKLFNPKKGGKNGNK